MEHPLEQTQRNRQAYKNKACSELFRISSEQPVPLFRSPSKRNSEHPASWKALHFATRPSKAACMEGGSEQKLPCCCCWRDSGVTAGRRTRRSAKSATFMRV